MIPAGLKAIEVFFARDRFSHDSSLNSSTPIQPSIAHPLDIINNRERPAALLNRHWLD